MDSYRLVCELFEKENAYTPELASFLLNKGEGHCMRDEVDIVECTWNNSEIWLSDSVSYYYLWIVKALIDKGEEIDLYDDVLKDAFKKALLKYKSYNELRRLVRGKRLYKILDLTADEFSSSLLILDPLVKYHYVSHYKREGLKKYMEYCKSFRDSDVEIVEFDIEDVFDKINVSDYDLVLVDPRYNDAIDDEFMEKVESLGFKMVCDPYDLR